MRKSRFSETKISTILQEVEAGKSIKAACREYGVSDATCYTAIEIRWDGSGPSEAVESHSKTSIVGCSTGMPSSGRITSC